MSKFVSRFRLVLLLALLAVAAGVVLGTRHWPLVGDAILLHYTAFLFDHGFAPYRDIIDINMPGCLLFDWTVMHTLGMGSAAWRAVDFLLLGAGTAAMIAIARPYDWLAGLFGGVLLAALHVRDGIDQAGERDLVLAVFLLIACACLLEAWRRNRWLWSAGFGLASGAAILIKPTAALWVVLMLLLSAVVLRRRRLRGGAHLLAACGAGLGVLAPAAAFLWREHALRAFLGLLRGIVAYHAAVDRVSVGWLIAHPLASTVLPVVAVWLYLAAVSKGWQRAERAALLLSVAFGVFAFVVQGKGFPYHRYPAEAFLLPLIGIDALLALRRRGLPRVAAAAVLLYAALVIAPVSAVKAAHYDWRNRDFEHALSADLTALGGPRLSSRVQCVDTFGGCIETLYDLRLVQSTGFLYDCYDFHQPQTPASERYRGRFLADVAQRPPQVIVVTDQLCFNEPAGYAKLDRWPAFAAWLNSHYALYAQRKAGRDVGWWPYPKRPVGYRVYVLSPSNR